MDGMANTMEDETQSAIGAQYTPKTNVGIASTRIISDVMNAGT
jgi:hypothetical protein